MIELWNGIHLIAGCPHICKWVKETGRLDHDQNMLPLVLPHIPEGGVVVDGGAYIGDHTVAYLAAVGPTGRVMAFEPNPEAYNCLRRNCPDAHAYRIGLDSGQSGTAKPVATLRSMEINSDSPGMSSLVKDLGPNVIMVETVPLDEFDLRVLDFLKLDIEGHEYQALQGAACTIARCRPKMLIEVNREALLRAGHTPEHLCDLIRSFGYSLSNIYAEQPVISQEHHTDILCVPV